MCLHAETQAGAEGGVQDRIGVLVVTPHVPHQNFEKVLDNDNFMISSSIETI
jgi:hypothetical protein